MIIAKNALVLEIVAGTKIRTKKGKRNAGKEVTLINIRLDLNCISLLLEIVIVTAAARIVIAIVGAVIVVNVIGNVKGIASRVRIAVVRAITMTTTDARNAHAVGIVTVTAGVTAIVTHAPGAAVHVVPAVAATVVAAAATITIAAVADVVRTVVATIDVAVIAIMSRHNRIAAVGNAAVASAVVVNVPM